MLPSLHDNEHAVWSLMRDLLRYQLVSRQWRRLIQTSPRIRTVLFYAPVAPAVSYIKREYEQKGMYGESSESPINDDMDNAIIPRYPSHWGNTRQDIDRTPVFYNPLLARFFDVISPTGEHAPAVHYSLPAFTSPHAGWRKMLITQPPIHTLFVEYDTEEPIFFRGEATDGWGVVCVSSETGEGVRTAAVLRACTYAGGIAWIKGSTAWKEYKGETSLADVRRGSSSDESDRTHLEGR